MDIEAMLVDSGAGEEKPTGTPDEKKPIAGDEQNPGEEHKETLNDPIDFAKTFDGFESVEQVKELAMRGKQFSPEAETELERLRQSKEQFEKLQAEYEKLKTVNPYKNENFYKLDKLSEIEKDNVGIYQKYLLGNPSDLEIVKLGEMLKNGDVFKDDPNALQRRIEAKYPALFDGSDEDDDEYKDALINLKLDAKNAKEVFDKKLGEIELPNAEKTQQEKEAADQEFIKSWQSDFAKIKEGLSALPINVLDSKEPGKEVKVMDMPLTEEESASIQKIAAGYIVNNRLSPTPENVEAAKKVAIGTYIANNFSKIQTAFANKIEEDSGIKWRAKLTNPGPGGAEHSPNRKQAFVEGSSESIMEDITHGRGF